MSGEFRVKTADAEYSRCLPASSLLVLDALVQALRCVDGAPNLSVKFKPDTINGEPNSDELLHVGVGRLTDFSVRLPESISSEERLIARESASDLLRYVTNRGTLHINHDGELTT